MARAPALAATALAATMVVACAARTDGGGEPAREASKAAAPPAASAPSTSAPSTSAASTPSAPSAPSGPPAKRGDPEFSAAHGESLGRVTLELVTGLDQVDATPQTLTHSLAEAPPEGVDVKALGPGAPGRLFGEAAVTKTEHLAYAVDASRESLWFDGDGDRRIGPSDRVERAAVAGGQAWFAVRGRARREVDGKPLETWVPMKIAVSLEGPAGLNRLDAYRRGRFDGKDGPVPLAITDGTFRGWFSHPGRDAILVDVNRDGRFDSGAESTERWRLGEPFPLGEVDAVVTAVGPFGEWIDLARSGKPSRRLWSLAIGTEAPDFSARDTAGREVALSKWRGKWVLLDFWATWCGPCRNELPHLKRLHATQPDLIVLGLSGDREKSALEGFVKEQSIDWAQVHEGAGAIQRSYRVDSFPRSFLIGPDGRIVARDLRGSDLPERVAKLRAAKP